MNQVIQVTNLNKSIGNQRILQNVNFTIQRGDVVGLVGPNGAGKTTIMKSILSLINIDSGEIIINGQKASYHHHPNLSHVGALIENPALYPYLTGLDHIRMYNRQAGLDEQTKQILSTLDMNQFIHQKVSGYSLGMKQKMGIMLALLNHPQLVILDEPMNGLDPKSNLELRKLIHNLANNGTAFLISSHILSELDKIINQVIVVNHGQIIEQASMSHVRQIGNHYLILQTNDNFHCRQLLTQNNYQVEPRSDDHISVKLSDPHSIQSIFDLIYSNHYQVLDIDKMGNDLEASLLQMIFQKQSEVPHD